MSIAQGTIVEFTADKLGTLRQPSGGYFDSHVVERGERGVYFGPHPAPELKEWHIVSVEHDGSTLYVPVAASQFKEA